MNQSTAISQSNTKNWQTGHPVPCSLFPVPSFDLFCVGNAMDDVFAETDADFFKRFSRGRPVRHVGLQEMAELFSALEEAACGGKAAIRRRQGGGAANTARAAAALGLKAAFSGDLAGGAPGIFVRLSCGGEAAIVACPPQEFGASEFDALLPKVGTPRVVYVEGFLLDRPGLVERCREFAGQDAAFALDCGAPHLAREHGGRIKKILTGKNVFLFANEEEWRNLSLTEAEAAASANAAIIVKLGARGAKAYAGGKWYEAPAAAVQADEDGLDTTGAGDAFAAGFLAAWLRGAASGMAECAAAGNEAALAAITGRLR